jgi:SNF2 family DNA or RNA helicase
MTKDNDFSIAWCQLNDEGDLLEKLIPGSVQISGSDLDEKKEEKFYSFIKGDVKKLITKPKIGAWGLNFQHCNHQVYFPSHSFEQKYQLVRRCWRFGQKRPVTIDTVFTEGERKIINNLKRKEAQATQMFDALVREMNNSISYKKLTETKKEIEVPLWL